MKVILALMCGLVVLFMGGCTLLALSGNSPLTLLFAAILFLNLAILGGLYGWKLQWLPAFRILGYVDLLIAAGFVATAVWAGTDEYGFWQFLMGIAAVFALKGFLSIHYARRLQTLE
jgi:hypothetical protein